MTDPRQDMTSAFAYLAALVDGGLRFTPVEDKVGFCLDVVGAVEDLTLDVYQALDDSQPHEAIDGVRQALASLGAARQALRRADASLKRPA